MHNGPISDKSAKKILYSYFEYGLPYKKKSHKGKYSRKVVMPSLNCNWFKPTVINFPR